MVAITLMARSELEIAWLAAAISLRSRSLTIKPAGSSEPRLMRNPLDRRSSDKESVAGLRKAVVA